jgi:hypothetical protein
MTILPSLFGHFSVCLVPISARRHCCTGLTSSSLLWAAVHCASVACSNTASNSDLTESDRHASTGAALPDAGQDASATVSAPEADVPTTSTGAEGSPASGTYSAHSQSSATESSHEADSPSSAPGNTTNDSSFNCSYLELMRHYKVSSLAVDDRCVDARFDFSEGAVVESWPCRSSDPQRFRLALQEDCSYALELQWGEAPYTYEWCLGTDATNVTLTRCPQASRFVIEEVAREETAESSYQLVSESGLCLTLSDVDGEPALLEECDATPLLTLDVSPTEEVTIPASADPASVEISPTNGGGLHIDAPLEASGVGIGVTDERTRWVDIRQEFSAQFAFGIQWDSDYMLSFLAATGFEDAAVEVILDGEYAGTATLRRTRELNDYQRSRAINLRLTGLDHRLGLRNVGGKPFGVADVVLWPINGRLADFGSVHPVSEGATNTLPTAAISDTYRSRLDDDGMEPHWACDWTFCFVEYDVTVERAGSFDFAVQFRTYDQFTGALLFVNGIQVGDIPFEVAAEGDPFAWSAPTTVDLEPGLNTIRLQHGDYLYEGTLSGQYAVRNPRLQPAN